MWLIHCQVFQARKEIWGYQDWRECPDCLDELGQLDSLDHQDFPDLLDQKEIAACLA